LAALGSNPISSTANITTTANINMSGVTATGNIRTTGNITGGNVQGGNLITTSGVVRSQNPAIDLFINSAQVTIGGGTYLYLGVPSGTTVAAVPGNLETYGNLNLGVSFITGLNSNINGDASQFHITGGSVGQTLITDGFGNLTFATSYANSNVAAYLPTYTGNVSGSNIVASANLVASGVVLSGNISYTPTYGYFYDTTTQINSNVGNAIPISYNTTDIQNGVVIVANTEITIRKTGIYNIQFSAQLEKSDAGSDVAYIWLDKNGNSVINSATQINLVGNGGRAVAAWNFVVSAAANDYYRLMWSSPNSNLFLAYDAATGVVPAIPSVILSVVPVGA
jgi:hypothetical protein